MARKRQAQRPRVTKANAREIIRREVLRMLDSDDLVVMVGMGQRLEIPSECSVYVNVVFNALLREGIIRVAAVYKQRRYFERVPVTEVSPVTREGSP